MTDSVSMFSTFLWQFLFFPFSIIIVSLCTFWLSQTLYTTQLERIKKWKVSFVIFSFGHRNETVFQLCHPQFPQENEWIETSRKKENMTTNDMAIYSMWIRSSFCCFYYFSFFCISVILFISEYFWSIQWWPQI